MAEFGDDCYFFFYSNCQHGAKCQFRHVPEALGTEIVCASWRSGRCQRRNCPYRHMNIEKNRNDITCYWESQPGGCQKSHCVFKHLKGRKVQEDDIDNVNTHLRKKIIKLPQNVSEKDINISSKPTSSDAAGGNQASDAREGQKVDLKTKVLVQERPLGDARTVITNRRTVIANPGLSEINEDVKSLTIDANRHSSGEENGSARRKIRIKRKPDLLIGVPSSDDAKGCTGSEDDDKKMDQTTKIAGTTKKHWRKRSRSDELGSLDDATQCKIKRSESSDKLSAEASQNVQTILPKDAQSDAEMKPTMTVEEPKTPLFSDDYKMKLVEAFGADLAASFINQGIKLDLTQMS